MAALHPWLRVGPLLVRAGGRRLAAGGVARFPYVSHVFHTVGHNYAGTKPNTATTRAQKESHFAEAAQRETHQHRSK